MRAFYPFEIFGFFENMGTMLAVGRMGQRRRNHSSKLLEKWSMESNMRVVDMETFAQPAFDFDPPSLSNSNVSFRSSRVAFRAALSRLARSDLAGSSASSSFDGGDGDII